MYTLLKYQHSRVVAYDNTYDKEYTHKRWAKRLSARRLEEVLSQLTVLKRDLLDWDEHVLELDIREVWGTQNPKVARQKGKPPPPPSPSLPPSLPQTFDWRT